MARKFPRIQVNSNGTKTTVLSVSVKSPSGQAVTNNPNSKGKVRVLNGTCDPVTDIRVYQN